MSLELGSNFERGSASKSDGTKTLLITKIWEREKARSAVSITSHAATTNLPRLKVRVTVAAPVPPRGGFPAEGSDAAGPLEPADLCCHAGVPDSSGRKGDKASRRSRHTGYEIVQPKDCPHCSAVAAQVSAEDAAIAAARSGASGTSAVGGPADPPTTDPPI